MMIRLGLLHQRFAYLKQEISFLNIYFIIIIVTIILSAQTLTPTAEMDPRVYIVSCDARYHLEVINVL